MTLRNPSGCISTGLPCANSCFSVPSGELQCSVRENHLTGSFCGPSMQDSISALGGGGLATPYLANLANSLSYALSAVTTLFGVSLHV
jgi:hypothetical protein